MKKIKYTPIFLIVVCSMVLFGCTKKTDQTQIQTQEQGQEEIFSTSLKQLMGMGKKVECSWQFEDPETGGMTTGVVYVDGERSRSEVRVRIENGGTGLTNIDSISITDGKTSYMWNEGQKTGTKYDIDGMEKLGKEMDNGNQNSSERLGGWDEMYEYKCKPWKVDESKFTLPIDVKFTDMMDQMKQVQEQSGQIQQGLEEVCNSLPEPQRSQCLESMERE